MRNTFFEPLKNILQFDIDEHEPIKIELPTQTFFQRNCDKSTQ